MIVVSFLRSVEWEYGFSCGTLVTDPCIVSVYSRMSDDFVPVSKDEDQLRPEPHFGVFPQLHMFPYVSPWC